MPTAIDAFLLTSQWRDTPDGLVLTFWLCSDQGPIRVRCKGERAVMFVERDAEVQCDDRRRLERDGRDMTTLYGTAVDAVYFSQRRALVEQRERLRRDAAAPLESDIKPCDRYLMERFITGSCRIRGHAQRRRGFTELVNPSMKSCDYRPTLSALSFDIETDGIDGPLLSIAAIADDRERVFMVGAGPPVENVEYQPDERAVLSRFFAFVDELDPDVLIGWNVVEFDLSYLQQRCEALGVRFALGRGGERAAVLAPQSEAQLPIARLPGRVVLDGIATLKAATYSFERFSLEHVSQQLLGRGKRIEDTDDHVKEIGRMFREDKAALADYNLEDCRLVRDIFAHTDLISFAVQRQRMTGLPMGRAGGSVAAFDFLYLPRLHRHGIVAADVGAIRTARSSPGGHVLPSTPGLYDNVLVLDFKSLYPSIIRTFKVDPMGLAFPGEQPIAGFDGAAFSRERHILPGMIASLHDERERAKRDGDEPLSRAIKILMNSFYGVLGTPACRFFNPRLASSITRRGHEIITRSRDWISERGRQVIYGDTDSLFVLIGAGVEPDECRRIGEELARELTAWWRERIREEHDTDSFLEMELETCFVRFFMPTLRGSHEGSAKRYAGLVVDSDPERRVIIKGLEAVRTDWTPLARDFQRELLRLVFLGEPFESYVCEVRRRLFAGELDEALVYRKRLRRAIDDYINNVPPHVKAARMLGRPVREVSYVWTTRGPQPVEQCSAPIDYHHYLERQLAPAADALLQCLDTSFMALAGDQLSLFS